MRPYVEALELNIGLPDSPEFVRADITDKTDIEIAAITKAVIDVMGDKVYRLTRHDCGHDEPEKKTPCVVVEI